MKEACRILLFIFGCFEMWVGVPLTRAFFETLWLTAFGDFSQSRMKLVDVYSD